MVTISCVNNNLYIEQDDIESVHDEFTRISNIIWSGDLNRYEISGKYRQLHFHGIGYLPNAFKYGKLTKLHGPNASWSIRYTPIITANHTGRISFEQAIVYVTKDDKQYGSRASKLTTNILRHENYRQRIPPGIHGIKGWIPITTTPSTGLVKQGSE